MNQKENLPVSEKYSLGIKEAADYFSIGIKRMRRLAEDNLGYFSAYNGNRFLIIRGKFEEYMQTNPILEEDEEIVLETLYDREALRDKDILNMEETVFLFKLSRRKFKKLLDEKEDLPFVALYRNRRIIIRGELERYLENNPDVKEEIKNGKSRVSKEKRF